MRLRDEAPSARKILIVEDEQLVAMDVEIQLRSCGYEIVGTADRGEDALRLVEATRPDLILMDVNLRGPVDGIAVAGELRRGGIDTPVLFITAYRSLEVSRRAESVPFSGYLTKPYQPRQLREAVRGALGDPEALDEESLLSRSDYP